MNGYEFSILSPELHELRLWQTYFDVASNNILANNDDKLSSERFLWFTDDHVEKFLEAEEKKTKNS